MLLIKPYFIKSYLTQGGEKYMSIFGLGKKKRGLANADRETRQRVARLGGESHGNRRKD